MFTNGYHNELYRIFQLDLLLYLSIRF